MNCLECDEAHPKRELTGGEWNRPLCDFFNYGKNIVCLRCDCKRPREESTPAGPRFGFERNNENMANTFNTRRTNLEPRMTNAAHLGHPLVGIWTGFLATHLKRESLIMFNPLPSDMFNRNQNSNAEEEQVRSSSNFPAGTRNEAMSFDNPRENLSFSRKPVNQTESKEDKEQAEKCERSDEDFLEIMRRGENQFVVSKKDRPLTSAYTTNATNFVPFIPFTPDYFTKKNKVPVETEASTVKDDSGMSASCNIPRIFFYVH